MINVCDSSNLDEILKIVDKDKLQNVYLYIDIKVYGLNTDNIETSVLMESSNISLILYKYYNSLQIFQNLDISDDALEELCNYIETKDFEMISGNINIIDKINSKLSNKYSISCGCIMKNEEKIDGKSNLTKLATADDCINISKLICSNKDIGGHYTVEGLNEQLVDRMLNRNCKNLIIEKDGKIISHFGVYADIDSLSVLGGLITKDEYKGNGYGRKVLDDLTFIVQSENKIPILYCYNEDIIKWYEKNNWKIVTECAQLKKIK